MGQQLVVVEVVEVEAVDDADGDRDEEQGHRHVQKVPDHMGPTRRRVRQGRHDASFRGPVHGLGHRGARLPESGAASQAVR